MQVWLSRRWRMTATRRRLLSLRCSLLLSFTVSLACFYDSVGSIRMTLKTETEDEVNLDCCIVWDGRDRRFSHKNLRYP